MTLVTSLLAACGGSNSIDDEFRGVDPVTTPDDADEPADGDDSNGDDSNGDDSNGDGSGDGSGDILNLTFASQADFDRMAANTVKGATAQLARSDAESLVVSPTWAAADDQFTVSTTVEPVDLVGATLSVDAAFAQAYQTDENMFVQFYFKDSSGRYANTEAAFSPSGRDGFFTHTEGPVALNYASENFDLTQVAEIGLEFNAGGKAADVNGDIELDNLKVTAGIDDGSGSGPQYEGDVVFDFSTGTHGAANDGSQVGLTHDSEQGALVLTPDWNAVDDVKFFVVIDEASLQDLEGATITWVLNIPQVYKDGGLSLQGFLQQNSGSYLMEFGDSWIDNSALVADSYEHYSYTAPALVDAARVGLQLKGASVPDETTAELYVKALIINYVK